MCKNGHCGCGQKQGSGCCCEAKPPQAWQETTPPCACKCGKGSECCKVKERTNQLLYEMIQETTNVLKSVMRKYLENTDDEIDFETLKKRIDSDIEYNANLHLFAAMHLFAGLGVSKEDVNNRVELFTEIFNEKNQALIKNTIEKVSNLVAKERDIKKE